MRLGAYVWLFRNIVANKRGACMRKRGPVAQYKKSSAAAELSNVRQHCRLIEVGNGLRCKHALSEVIVKREQC